MAWSYDYDKKANVLNILKDGSVFLTQETDSNDGWDKWKSKEEAEAWGKAWVAAHEKEDAEKIAAEEAAKKANEELAAQHEAEAAVRAAEAEAADKAVEEALKASSK